MKRKQKDKKTEIDKILADSEDVTLSLNSEAFYRIQKETSQNKLESHNDWKSGMEAFRSSAQLELEKIPLLEDYLHNVMESLLQRVLLLENKVEKLEK